MPEGGPHGTRPPPPGPPGGGGPGDGPGNEEPAGPGGNPPGVPGPGGVVKVELGGGGGGRGPLSTPVGPGPKWPFQPGTGSSRVMDRRELDRRSRTQRSVIIGNLDGVRPTLDGVFIDDWTMPEREKGNSASRFFILYPGK